MNFKYYNIEIFLRIALLRTYICNLYVKRLHIWWIIILKSKTNWVKKKAMKLFLYVSWECAYTRIIQYYLKSKFILFICINLIGLWCSLMLNDSRTRDRNNTLIHQSKSRVTCSDVFRHNFNIVWYCQGAMYLHATRLRKPIKDPLVKFYNNKIYKYIINILKEFVRKGNGVNSKEVIIHDASSILNI